MQNSINFGARLEINSPWGMLDRAMSEAEKTKLAEKANKIGLKDDVIEFSFGPIKDTVENSVFSHEPVYLPDFAVEILNRLKTKFIQNDKVKEEFAETICQKPHENIIDNNISKMEENLNILYERFPNDI